jgi:hypothetical protein
VDHDLGGVGPAVHDPRGDPILHRCLLRDDVRLHHQRRHDFDRHRGRAPDPGGDLSAARHGRTANLPRGVEPGTGDHQGTLPAAEP